MASRPRRPRTSGKPVETSAQSPETGNEPTLNADETPEGVEASPDEVLASSSEAQTQDEPAEARRERGQPLPPPESQPGAPSDPLLAEQAGHQDGPSSETASPADADASAQAEFAREEGLSDEAPRRHLGEFEDDEVVADAAHPHAVPVSSDAYRSGDEAALPVEPETPSSSPGLGALVGAGLAGAVLALGGAAALSYAGLLPAREVRETAQYAPVGDVERLSGDLAGLRENVEQLQSAQAAGGSGTSYAPATDLAALSDRVAAAERNLDELAGAEPDPAVSERVEEVAGTAEAAREAAQGAQDALGEIGRRIDTVEASVGDYETRIAAIEEANRQAGVALSAASLKAAIDRGGPFMSELEAFAVASGGGETVDALRDHAAEGVPTQRELLARWPEVERDIRAATAAPSGTGVGDQLLAGLSSLVQTRPTGQAAADGDGTAAALSRMSTALNSGDLAAWRSEWEELPEEGRNASAAFAETVEARRQAETVVDDTLSRAIGASAGNEG